MLRARPEISDTATADPLAAAGGLVAAVSRLTFFRTGPYLADSFEIRGAYPVTTEAASAYIKVRPRIIRISGTVTRYDRRHVYQRAVIVSLQCENVAPGTIGSRRSAEPGKAVTPKEVSQGETNERLLDRRSKTALVHASTDIAMEYWERCSSKSEGTPNLAIDELLESLLAH